MLRFHLAILDPNELNDPSYHRVWRNPPVARTFSVSKMGTHTRFPHSAFTHANNTSLEHGGWVTPPDLESILIGRLIIRATYFVASVEKTLVLDDRDGSRLSCSPAARLDILDSDALLLFYVHEDGSQGGDRGVSRSNKMKPAVDVQ
jgi:hypothetical protein